MKTIRMYGEMGKLFGREYKLDVETPAEAVRALCVQVKGFRDYLFNHANDYYKVFVGGSSIDDKQLCYPASDREIIRIAPAVQGAGGGFGRVILGAALIGVGVMTGGASMTMGAAWAAGGAQFLGYVATQVGISLVLGGVAEMLSPSQSAPSSRDVERPENKPSMLFDGAVNTTAQGNGVPLCYGKMLVGSQVISAGLVTE